MKDPERHSPESLKPMDRLTWEHMGKRLDRRAQLARVLGIQESHFVIDLAKPRHTHERRSGEESYGASFGKLIMPKMADDIGLSGNTEITWKPDPEQKEPTGGGRFDQVGVEPHATVTDLVEDMCGPGSGNKAFGELARYVGGAQAINEYLKQQGYAHTRVKDSGDGRGGTFLGETTPDEMNMIFGHITSEVSNTGLTASAKEMLLDPGAPKDEHSILQYIPEESNITRAYIKLADFPGDPDKKFNVRYSVENEAGELHTRDGQRLRYVIMTRTFRHDRFHKPTGAVPNWLAKNFLRQQTAEIAAAVQGRPIAELGNRARCFA